MLLTHEIRFFSFWTNTNEVLMMSMMRLNNIVVLVRKFTNSQVDNQHKFAIVLNLGVGYMFLRLLVNFLPTPCVNLC